MINTVFVLGAGASKEAGAPLMADFLDVADMLHKSGSVADKGEHFERVFKAIGSLQKVHSKSELDITNIESIFATFEMAKVIQKMPGSDSDDIDSLIASLKEVICETLEKTIPLSLKGNAIMAPDPYINFVDLIKKLRDDIIPSHNISIITFNYDIACDLALYKGGLGPNYCFDFPTHSSSVPLLKLHGSLNWASCSECNEIVPWDLDKFFKKFSWNNPFDHNQTFLQISRHFNEFIHCKKQVLPEPVIVPPTWNTSEYHQSLTKVWSRAAEDLGKAENIFVMGYSLPESDAFFRYLYALGTVGDAPLKRFYVYDPELSGSVKNRFQGMLGSGAKSRFKYISKIFTKAIQGVHSEFPKKR